MEYGLDFKNQRQIDRYIIDIVYRTCSKDLMMKKCRNVQKDKLTDPHQADILESRKGVII